MNSQDIANSWREEFKEKFYDGNVIDSINISKEELRQFSVLDKRYRLENHANIKDISDEDYLCYQRDCLGLILPQGMGRIKSEKQRDCKLKIIMHKSLIKEGIVIIPEFDWIEIIDIQDLYMDKSQSNKNKLVDKYRLEKGWCEPDNPQFIFTTDVDGVEKFYNGLFYKNRNHKIGCVKYKYWPEDLCFVKTLIEYTDKDDVFIYRDMREAL